MDVELCMLLNMEGFEVFMFGDVLVDVGLEEDLCGDDDFVDVDSFFNLFELGDEDE